MTSPSVNVHSGCFDNDSSGDYDIPATVWETTEVVVIVELLAKCVTY